MNPRAFITLPCISLQLSVIFSFLGNLCQQQAILRPWRCNGAGDVISFGTLTCAFQLVPVFRSDQQESALQRALDRARGHARPDAPQMTYANAAAEVRRLSTQGDLVQARNLLVNHLLQSPDCFEGWAQVGLR